MDGTDARRGGREPKERRIGGIVEGSNNNVRKSYSCRTLINR